MKLVLPEKMQQNLDHVIFTHVHPPISNYDPAAESHLVIPRNINTRKSKNGKWFAIVDVIDHNNVETKIRIWNVEPQQVKEDIAINELFPSHDPLGVPSDHLLSPFPFL